MGSFHKYYMPIHLCKREHRMFGVIQFSSGVFLYLDSRQSAFGVFFRQLWFIVTYCKENVRNLYACNLKKNWRQKSGWLFFPFYAAILSVVSFSPFLCQAFKWKYSNHLCSGRDYCACYSSYLLDSIHL